MNIENIRELNKIKKKIKINRDAKDAYIYITVFILGMCISTLFGYTIDDFDDLIISFWYQRRSFSLMVIIVLLIVFGYVLLLDYVMAYKIHVEKELKNIQLNENYKERIKSILQNEVNNENKKERRKIYAEKEAINQQKDTIKMKVNKFNKKLHTLQEAEKELINELQKVKEWQEFAIDNLKKKRKMIQNTANLDGANGLLKSINKTIDELSVEI